MKKKTIAMTTAFGTLVATVPAHVMAMPVELDTEVTNTYNTKAMPEELVIPENEWAKVNNQEDLDRLWNYNLVTKEDGSQVIVLTGYKGVSENTKVEIPREVDGKRVELNHINAVLGGTTHIKVADGDDNNKVVLGNSNFNGTATNLYSNRNIEYLDLSGLEVKPTSFDQTFRGATNLKYVDLSGWDVSEISGATWVFLECSALKYINLSGWDIPSSAGTSGFYSGVSADYVKLNNVDITTFKKIKPVISANGVLEVNNLNLEDTTSLSGLFEGLGVSEIKGLDDLDVSRVTDMSNLFKNCSNLTSIASLENWDTSSLTNMGDMFDGVRNVTDFSPVFNWDTSSVTMMNGVFINSGATTLDLTTWDTRQVINMNGMFRNMQNLTEVKFGENWDMANVTQANEIFRYNNKLHFLDLSEWNIRENLNINNWFTVGSSVSDRSFLIVTDNERLQRYNFTGCNRVAFTLTLNTGNGQFEGGSKTKTKSRFFLTVAEYADIDQTIKSDIESLGMVEKEGDNLLGWEIDTVPASHAGRFNATYNAIWEKERNGDIPDVPNHDEVEDDMEVEGLTFNEKLASIVTGSWNIEEKILMLKELLVSESAETNERDDVYKRVIKELKNGTDGYNTTEDIEELIQNIKESLTPDEDFDSEMEVDPDNDQVVEVEEPTVVDGWLKTETLGQVAYLWDYEVNEDDKLVLNKLKETNTKTTGVKVEIPKVVEGKEVVLANLNTETFPNATHIRIAEGEGTVGLLATDINNGFKDNTTLQYVNLEGLDVSNVTDMSQLFSMCDNLDYIKLLGWDIQENTNILGMFYAREDATDEQKKILVITKSAKINGYDFKSSNRLPHIVRHFANGGKFFDNEEEGLPIVNMEAHRYTIETDNMDELGYVKGYDELLAGTPVREGFNFVGWETEAPEPTNVFELVDRTYKAIWEAAPTTPDQPEDGEEEDGGNDNNQTQPPTDTEQPNPDETPDGEGGNDTDSPEEDDENAGDDNEGEDGDTPEEDEPTTPEEPEEPTEPTFIEKVTEIVTEVAATIEEKIAKFKELLANEGADTNDTSDEVYEEAINEINTDITNSTGKYTTLDAILELIQSIKDSIIGDEDDSEGDNPDNEGGEDNTTPPTEDDDNVGGDNDNEGDGSTEDNTPDVDVPEQPEQPNPPTEDGDNGETDEPEVDNGTATPPTETPDTPNKPEGDDNTGGTTPQPPTDNDNNNGGNDTEVKPPSNNGGGSTGGGSTTPPTVGGGSAGGSGGAGGGSSTPEAKPEAKPETKPTNGIVNLEELDKTLQDKVDSIIAETTVSSKQELVLNVAGDKDDMSNIDHIEVTKDGIFAVVDGKKLKFGATIEGLDLDLTNARVVRLDMKSSKSILDGQTYKAVAYKKTKDGLKISSGDLENLLITSKVAEPFVDVNDTDWFKADVEEAYNYGFTMGTSATTYNPKASITRGEFAVMIARALELKAKGNTGLFTDVQGKWYENEVQALKDAGIVNGLEDGTFGGDKTITRQEAATFITRMLTHMNVDVTVGNTVEFIDMDDISAFAKESIQYLASQGVLEGGGDGKFNPTNNLTRAEMAKILVQSLRLTDLY